jgi:hypothetical protein
MNFSSGIINFSSGVSLERETMRKVLSDGRVLLDIAYRDANNMPTHVQRTVAAGKVESVERSLKSRSLKFLDAIDISLRENNGAGKKDLYAKLRRDLGNQFVDSEGLFADLVEDYMQDREDEGLAENTLANYAGIIMRVLSRVKRKRQYQNICLPELEYSRKFRSRVRSAEEKLRFENVMNGIRSHLKPSIHFAERNPIRGRSDQWNLTRENLVLSSQYPAHIEFIATKTREKKPQSTYLVELDEFDLQYFDWIGITFPDCPFLFPGFHQDRFGTWRWWKMGNPRKHFSYICNKANVIDFHYHDLKHEAVTYMLHVRDIEGKLKYSVQDLKDLGIQFSDRALKVYCNLDAHYVLDRLACYADSIGSQAHNA